jgi:LPXTG-site transpeptidase (sortase) family protein
MKYIQRIVITLCFFLLSASSAHAIEFSNAPTHIVIPSLNISLPVTTAQIIDDTWDVSTNGVSFGESTSIPGNKGNTVIFGHALPQFFESLPSLPKGGYIHVFTGTDWFVYKAVKTTVVDPEDVQVLAADRDYELTLYTCVGANYEKRFVVKARLVSSPRALIPEQSISRR